MDAPGSGHSLINRIDHWEPGCWVVAVLKLRAPFQVETENAIVRYPEQWVYFLWRPMERALPFITPDCVSLTVGDPFDQLASTVKGAPIYLLAETECDWPSWLEILLICDNSPPWLRDVILCQQGEARQAQRQCFRRLYGDGDEFEFESFMKRILTL